MAAGGLAAVVADGAVVGLLRGDVDQLARAYGNMGMVTTILGLLFSVSILFLLEQVLRPVIRAMFR